VEGQAGGCFADDVANDGVEVGQNVNGWDAECVDACFAQPRIAVVVALRTVSPRVRFAVDLDCEPCVAAEEI
jgi:hypothetical protein